MKQVIFLLCLLILSSLVLAHGDTASQLGFSESGLVGTDLPRSARSLFGNQRINLYTTLDSGEQEIHGIATEDGVITKFSEMELESSTLQVYTSESSIKEIMDAKNQPKELQKALSDGRITYRAIGIKNKIKFKVVGMLASVAGWFKR